MLALLTNAAFHELQTCAGVPQSVRREVSGPPRSRPMSVCGAYDRVLQPVRSEQAVTEHARRALEAQWLAENPPLLRRQKAKSEICHPSGWRPDLFFERC